MSRLARSPPRAPSRPARSCSPPPFPLSCVAPPPHPRAVEQVRRGYAHLAAGDRERAEVAFEHALEMAPDLAEARAGLGVALRSRRARTARHWPSSTPPSPPTPTWPRGTPDRGEALLALGHAASGRGRPSPIHFESIPTRSRPG